MKKMDYRAELQKEYEHWNQLFTQGGQDPLWADGVNLNLIRNHIIACRKVLEQEGGAMPEEYGWPLPPEVSKDYMARTKEIWYQGIESYQKYIRDEDYQYLEQVSGILPENIKKKSNLENVLGFVRTVRTALEQKDYITLRRHEHPERYLEAFAQCRERIEEMLYQEMGMTERLEEPEQGTMEKQGKPKQAAMEKQGKPKQESMKKQAGTEARKVKHDGQMSLFQIGLERSR